MPVGSSCITELSSGLCDDLEAGHGGEWAVPEGGDIGTLETYMSV